METQTRLSRHNKFISAENIIGIFSVSSDDSLHTPSCRRVANVELQFIATLRQEGVCKRVIWRDGEYSNNIFRRNKFIMTTYPSLSLHLIVLYIYIYIICLSKEKL